MGPWTFLLFVACTPQRDPLEALDQRYTNIALELASADRDTARNVHNQEARGRKAKAEEARVAFFRDPAVQDVIEEARTGPAEAVDRVKADAYWRHMVTARPWSAEEKQRETQILGELEEAASAEASWRSPDGAVVVDLTQGWGDASRAADPLSQDLRDELAVAWVSQRAQGVGDDLQDLVRLRNEVARREGFDNYWELSLASQGISPEDVDAIVAELTEVVVPINQRDRAALESAAATTGLPLTWANLPLIRRTAGLETGRDSADAFFDADKAEERVITALNDMGIPTTGWQVYSGPSRYVRQGVYGFPIDPPEEVAIVVSQDRRWSMWQYEAMAHEGGHAVWWRALSEEARTSPVLWEPPSPWFEGFASFFERLVYEPSFSARYVTELPEAERAALATWRRSHMASWITDSIVDTLAERRLYEDPTNLAAVARTAAEARARLTGLPNPPEPEAGGVYDASLISNILWNYPAYAQNYLFAYMTEAWMHEAVRKEVGDPVGNPKVGPLLFEKLVRAPVTSSFPERLSAMLPGDRTAPLKHYLEGQ